MSELLYDIRQLQSNCGGCSYEAPSTTRVTVSVPEGDDLTIGFDIWEYHREGEDVRLCRGASAIEYDELQDTDYYLCPSLGSVAPYGVDVNMRIGDWIWE